MVELTPKYDAMRRAIHEASKIDFDKINDVRELKHIIDTIGEAERQLAYIRLRAQREAGQLLRERWARPGPPR
jgi:hypothetical protein